MSMAKEVWAVFIALRAVCVCVCLCFCIREFMSATLVLILVLLKKSFLRVVVLRCVFSTAFPLWIFPPTAIKTLLCRDFCLLFKNTEEWNRQEQTFVRDEKQVVFACHEDASLWRSRPRGKGCNLNPTRSWGWDTIGDTRTLVGTLSS